MCNISLGFSKRHTHSHILITLIASTSQKDNFYFVKRRIQIPLKAGSYYRSWDWLLLKKQSRYSRVAIALKEDKSVTLSLFRISISSEYPGPTKMSIYLLVPFITTQAWIGIFSPHKNKEIAGINWMVCLIHVLRVFLSFYTPYLTQYTKKENRVRHQISQVNGTHCLMRFNSW